MITTPRRFWLCCAVLLSFAALGVFGALGGGPLTWVPILLGLAFSIALCRDIYLANY